MKLFLTASAEERARRRVKDLQERGIEADHDALLDFVEAAQLDWCGFFAYSPEEGTYATRLAGEVDSGLRDDRLAELRELQADRLRDLIGRVLDGPVPLFAGKLADDGEVGEFVGVEGGGVKAVGAGVLIAGWGASPSAGLRAGPGRGA